MTIDELIERLEDYRDEFGGDTEVRLMTQQNWPFENSICRAFGANEIQDARRRRRDEPDDDELVYIVEGSQIGYGNKAAWDAAN